MRRTTRNLKSRYRNLHTELTDEKEPRRVRRSGSPSMKEWALGFDEGTEWLRRKGCKLK